MSSNVDPGIFWLLNAEKHDHKRSTVYECVDKVSEAVPGSHANINDSPFYHLGAVCGVGLPCPPYVSNRPITCVMCTI